ncbi:MAG TPA: PilT/PilU family type 4a pilus ATPase [Smithellaceae bacterium]|jgi:twitching motility protein PilT|nr:PilT/PilU family type 4a pilus ATPase [Smithellaceae bacterium]OPZ53221.1 MAG: Twitching mobility protein [Deltaproteobacteria bacterium ADurb.BinA014]HOZ61281.1 PilT/PilU family type 4a pilus ATPase [Smithellaceae bacterium]HPM71173.1 PilT/PilU family type 4a pilus ATPase [Smithellaceae bacterium]HPW24060.1 PilT/PilU family type 4a pilus ATPase [Smithellaceae bacterium]
MKKPEIDYILTKMLESNINISDCILTVGKPFQVETAGQLVPVELEPTFEKLTPFQTEIFALNLINQDQRLLETLIREGSCDLSYELPGIARFRVNIFSQLGHYSIVLRKLESKIPSCAELGLPEAFYSIAAEKNGIVLITGATGTGKTTSLAAVINEINEHNSVHIITLEDPVEYMHSQKKATINQRELGKDFDTFANGLRAALRQAPNVILVGEIRDRESVEIALNAAETGHLVLSTLHTIDAGQTINRILGMFNIDEENQIRTRLADSLRWIVCQRLMPKVGGGRIAAFEAMGTSLRVKDIILHGESEGKTFFDVIRQGKAFGMITFDSCIVELYEKGLITEETARAYASNKSSVGRGIDTIKSARGEKTTDLHKLEVDFQYGKSKVDPWKI